MFKERMFRWRRRDLVIGKYTEGEGQKKDLRHGH